jgi:CHASE2 domain-containing sensor protein
MENRFASLPTVAYLTNVCLLVISWSSAVFSWYWLQMMAMVGCLARSTWQKLAV